MLTNQAFTTQFVSFSWVVPVVNGLALCIYPRTRALSGSLHSPALEARKRRISEREVRLRSHPRILADWRTGGIGGCCLGRFIVITPLAVSIPLDCSERSSGEQKTASKSPIHGRNLR